MKSRMEDRSYHEARAEAELALADASADPAVSNAHRELAALHRRHTMVIVEGQEPAEIRHSTVALARGH